MKFKPVLRYQLLQYRNALFVFYSLLYGLIIFILILKYICHCAWCEASGIYLEGITMLACLINGIVLFKSAFRVSTSCRVSRKCFFCSFAAASFLTSAFVSLINLVNSAVFPFLNYRANYSSMLASDFITVNGNGAPPTMPLTFPLLIKNWLWSLLAYFALGMLGFLIAALYYRMSKPVKILVSVGVPAFFLLFIPLLDANVTHNGFGHFFSTVWAQWINWGLNPGFDLLSRLSLTALFAGGTWLLLRRAELKA